MEQTEKQTIITSREAEIISRICGLSRSSVMQLVRGVWSVKGSAAIGKKERILTHLDHIRAIDRRHDEDCREEIEEYVATHRWAPEDDNSEASPKPGTPQ